MVTLNITYNGLSVDYPLELDHYLSDSEVKRVAVEVVRSGHARGLHIANFSARGFDGFVVDRFDVPGGKSQRIYLRPKVPFGAAGRG